MAEDGNLKFITSLTSVGETYDSVAGSAQNLFDQTGTPMQEMEANTRKLQQALYLWEKRSWNWPTWCCRLWWRSSLR